MEEMPNTEFTSTLKKPIQRAKSGWLHHAFTGKINTYAEFIDHFKIPNLITALSPEVRGEVLCECNGGGDRKRAAKMSKEIVGATIESMYLDKIVTADDICRKISTDHMVEVLKPQELYRFLFGKKVSSKAFMEKVLEIILKEHLLGEGVATASEFMKAIGDAKIIHVETPARLLAVCQLAMLTKNRGGAVFTDDDLVGVYTPKEVVEYVALNDLFAVVEAVAKANFWIEEAPKAEPSKPELPAGALDSAPPAAPAAEEKTDGEPEVEVGRASVDDVLTLDVDGDDDDNEQTTVGRRPAELQVPHPPATPTEKKKR